MSSIKKNYTYQVLYEVLAIILPIFTAPYITRTLGADSLGVYTYAVSIVNIFLSISRLGVVTHGSRAIASCSHDREERSKTFWSIYVVQAIFALTVTVVYLLYVLIFILQDRLIYLILIIMVASHALDISWLYMGMENFKKTAIRNTVVKIISLALIFLLVRSRSDLWIYTLIMSGCIVLGHVTLWKDFKKQCDWYKPTFPTMVQQLKPLLVLFVPTIAVTIYTIISKIILGAISGTTEVAFYEYTSTIVSIPLGFITSFGAVLLPRLSNMIAADAKENEKQVVVGQSLVFIIFLSSAMSFGLIAVAEELIPIYYGDEFLSCITLLVVMATKLPFMAWANIVRSTCLIPNKKDKQYIVTLFGGAVISVIANLVLIPAWGSVGAVVASVCAEAVVCLLQTFFVRKNIPLFRTFIKCVPFIVFGGIMLVCVRQVANVFDHITILGLFIEICVGALLYLILSLGYYCTAIERINPCAFLKKVLFSFKKSKG